MGALVTAFHEGHAREILRLCDLDDYIKIDERGVWPSVSFDPLLRVETELLRWRPAEVYKGEPCAPDVLDTPALPFPFTARELAAFMLGGVGYFVAERYGEWSDGPDEDVLLEMDPSANLARAAIVSAYGAYRDALAEVGCALGETPDTALLVRQLLSAPGGSEDAATQPWERNAEGRRPLQRGTAQEAAILDALRLAGNDPRAMPKNSSGKPGQKAAMRAALVGSSKLFPQGGTQFDKAWDRLRSRGEIVDKA